MIARWMCVALVGATVIIWCGGIAYSGASECIAAEVREYEIDVKGKPSGTTSTTIVKFADGVTTISTDAFVTLDFLVYAYHYEFHGREQWQGDQLVSVDNRAVDGGTKLALRASVDTHGSVLEAPGKPVVTGPIPAMTTNFWRAPSGTIGSSLVVLDADQGVIRRTTVKDILSEQIPIAGSTVRCLHYVLHGDLAADLWFDDQRRLVRQDTVEDGYPVEVRLVRVTKDPPQVARR